jgi:hypothetical protein
MFLSVDKRAKATNDTKGMWTGTTARGMQALSANQWAAKVSFCDE